MTEFGKYIKEEELFPGYILLVKRAWNAALRRAAKEVQNCEEACDGAVLSLIEPEEE